MPPPLDGIFWIAGVDGCKTGWVAAFQHPKTGELAWEVFETFAGIVASRFRPALVAVDMPIGLVDRGQRHCDVEARRMLGPRRSSVFPPPIRPVLGMRDYQRANQTSQRLHGIGLSKQAFLIGPKIREVEAEVLAYGPERVKEAHPELAFWAMNGRRPLRANKRSPEGQRLRRRLLKQQFGPRVWRLLAGAALRGAGMDDVHDALAVLWTARRLLRGEAERVPADPPRDRLGLPMEINF